MKKNLSMILCAILLTGQALLPSPAYAGIKEQEELRAVMEEINEKNMELDAPQDSTSQYRYNFKNNRPKVTKKDNDLMWKDYDKKNVKKTLSAAAAKKEVHWLFRLLRSQYGLYTYYGGDASFEKAKDMIIKEIGTDPITAKKYQKLLHKHLGFITDAHLAIGEELFNAPVRLFSDESVHYYKEGEQFFAEGSQEDALVEINGTRPDTYLKRAIDENGYLTYYPYAMLKQKKDSWSCQVKYQSGRTENITLHPAEYSYQDTIDQLYRYEHYDGAAYVEMNQAYMEDDYCIKARRQFLKDTTDMKKQKTLIIDLQNNTGGDGTLIDQWFLKYTGKALLPNYSTLRIRPVWINSAKELKEWDEFCIEYGLEKSGKFYYCQTPDHQYLKNKTRQMFVLTSRRTSSAAEAMTDAVRNIENSVVIGTNTGGVLINMANYSMAMPYSGLYLQFGESMQYFDNDYFTESYGMEPDIYLTGKDLDKRLELFFETYANIKL